MGDILTFNKLGREPWSSGYGKRLRSKGRGFESQHRILDGHFLHTFVVKICIVCLKRPKIKTKKEAEVGPFKKTFNKLLTQVVYLKDVSACLLY